MINTVLLAARFMKRQTELERALPTKNGRTVGWVDPRTTWRELEMNEILKLAKECALYECSSKWYVGCEEELKAFYRAAYNAGIEAACKPVRDRMIGYAVDDSDLKRLEQDIRALEMKP